MLIKYLDGPDFDGFVIRCSKKGRVVAAELNKMKQFRLISARIAGNSLEQLEHCRCDSL
jgi:hypothetical protein